MLDPCVCDLPDDPAALKALLIESRSERAQDLAEIAELEASLQHRELTIQKLTLQLAKLRRMQFGRSSEKVDREIEQLELLVEELESPTPVEVRVLAKAEAKAPSPRREFPAALPRESIPIDPPECQCPACGGALKSLGEDVTEILERVPSHFKVIRQIRSKLACTKCDAIVQAPAPVRPIARGMAGPGLLAHVLVSKYADHLPLYRQSQIYQREGVDLERSTLADWVGQCSALLTPLVDALAKHVISATKLHADDTPVPVLSPGLGRTQTGRLWTYVRDDRPSASDTPPAVLFRYSPDRRGEHPREHLKSFKGTLQADGYAGFHHLYGGGGVQEAACWAHVRRKFFDLSQAGPSPIADDALKKIGELYAIETDLRGKPPEERRMQRQARAGPLLDALRRWLGEQASRLSAKSELAGAIRYALSRWPALTRYRDDGRLEIDNNAAERALRAVALGRKNYLFCGSDAGGERAAAMYSLIGTAKLNGVDPEAYLRIVLERIAEHPVTKLDELLPWRLADQCRHAK